MKFATNMITSFTLLGVLLGATLAHAGHHESGQAMDQPNIVQVAASNEDFSTLVAAIKAAGLADVLSGKGPYTVFAPTNKAFANLPDGTLDMLLLPENKDKLVAILTYHVVSGEVPAAEVVKLTEVTTVQGATASISATDDGVTIDGANVIATDIETSNGVIHVIDAVITPS